MSCQDQALSTDTLQGIWHIAMITGKLVINFLRKEIG